METLLVLLLFSSVAAFLLTRFALGLPFAELALRLLKAALLTLAAAYALAFAIFYRPEAWWPMLVEMAGSLKAVGGDNAAATFAALVGATAARNLHRLKQARSGAAQAVPDEPSEAPRRRGKRRLGLVAATLGAAVLVGCSMPGDSARDGGGADLTGEPERLRAVVLANQIVFHGRGETAEAVCRCGPKLYLAEIAKPMRQAVVAIEDRRFFRHRGIDPNGVIRAGLRAVFSLGRRVEGASTIPQQLIKNTVLTSDRDGGRKWAEWRLAWTLGSGMSNSDMLAAYLNQMVFAYSKGRPVVGVENAARHFFGRSARDLNLWESALLAGLLRAPSSYNPRLHPERAAARAKLVLAAMVEQGMIAPAEAKAAMASGARRKGALKPVFPETRSFVQWVLADLKRDMPGVVFDRTTRIPLTMEVSTQANAERALERAMRKVRALAFAEVGFTTMGFDGRVVAMVGQRDFSRRQLNFVTQTRRQPASTMKSFVFAAAFEKGVAPPLRELTGKFAVSDRDSAVSAATRVGAQDIAALARRLGILSPLHGTATALALGASEVSLLELTTAYAPFATDGYAVRPYGHLGVVQGWRLAAWHRPERRRVLSGEVAETLHAMLRAVVTEGTGWPAQKIKDAAGKTGTNGESGGPANRDAWFIGMTGRHLSGLWIGRPDNGPMAGVKGSTAARIWAAVEEALPTQ